MIRNKLALGIYLILIPFSFLIFGGLWSLVISKQLYYCSDRIPLFDFFPPFVHGFQYGDYYIKDAGVVYIIWLIFVVLIFLTPAILLKNLKGVDKV